MRITREEGFDYTIDKRLVASRLALEEAKLAEELSLPSSSLSLRSTSTRSQQLNPASVREGTQELTISALAKHTAEQQSSHVVIMNRLLLVVLMMARLRLPRASSFCQVGFSTTRTRLHIYVHAQRQCAVRIHRWHR